MGFIPDLSTGKPIYDGDISDPVGQFQAAADYAESMTSITVATVADLEALPFKRVGMLAWVRTPRKVLYAYDGGWRALAGQETPGTVTPVAGTTVGSSTQFWRDHSGLVHGHIELSRTSIPTDPIAIVAGGFRPSGTWRTAGGGAVGGVAAPVMVQVLPSGNIQVWGASSNTNVQFDVNYVAAN